MAEQALILVTLGALLLVGLAAKALGRLTHVPGVTLLLLLGVSVGPIGLDLLPEASEEWFPLLARIALVSIGFLLGHEFTTRAVRERGREVLILSGVVTLVTAVSVTGGLALLGLPLPMALLVGVIATATDPAATLAVVDEVKAKGPFTRTLLGVVAVDDVWGLVLYSLLVPVAVWLGDYGQGAGLTLGLIGLRELGGGVLLGLVLGVPMAFLTGRLRAGEPTRLEAMGFILLCGGLAEVFGVSYLLAAVVMGATVANLARHHDRPFHAIENLDAPFLVTFFVLAGASMRVEGLRTVGPVVLAYVGLRALGRELGVLGGARLARSTAPTRKWMGAALLPQAGVALGLALAVGDRFPDLGERILPVAVVATVVYELIGPVMTRLALRRVGEARA